ncbi:unnamed protein product, partial [Ascophyllum nodosum]
MLSVRCKSRTWWAVCSPVSCSRCRSKGVVEAPCVHGALHEAGGDERDGLCRQE